MFRLDPFAPARLLKGPHAQTIGARLLRSTAGVGFHRERLETPDGDFVDLDFVCVEGVTVEPAAPLAVILHGLEGSARSKYALETYRRLANLGIASVGFNFRSCSGGLNRNARLYHSGETGDIRFVLETLSLRSEERPMVAIGFSLGGNVLLKYLGERESVPGNLMAAAAVSVPFDLSVGADHLETGFARVYRWRLMRSLRAKTLAKRPQLEGLLDFGKVAAALTFREFDDAATAPLHGFEGAEDYYSRSSSRQYLRAVNVPTLLIQSRDDPFLPPECLPYEEVAANGSLRAAFTERGGHVGFLEGSAASPRFWAERTVAAFVAGQVSLPIQSVGGLPAP